MIDSAQNLSSPYNSFLQVKNNPQVQPASLPPGPIASVKLTATEKEEKSNAFTKTVAGMAIGGAIVGLFLGKGASSAFYKKLNSYMQKLDDKIYEYSEKSRSLGFLQKLSLSFNKGLRKTLDYLKISNNLTAIKDAGFQWICAKTGLKKPMDWVTKKFKNITVLTSKRAYENARNITDANIAELREIIPVINKTDEKQAQYLTELLIRLESQIQNTTNSTIRTTRLKDVETATRDVGTKVSKELLEIVKKPNKQNLEKLRLYRTEVQAAEGKEVLLNRLQEARRGFTFNIEDKTRIMSEACDELGRIIKFEDKNTRKYCRELSKQIKEYADLSGKAESDDRTKLVQKMQVTVNAIKTCFGEANYSKETKKLFEGQIKEINTILQNTDQKGTIEEILTLLNNAGLKDKDAKTYFRAKNLTQQIRNAANKAFDTELKLYDKFAEYSVGSAPTDVLGMLIPAGIGAYAISKGDSKDEKVSATLKAGIPIIGGIGTTFVAAARLMTNIQGLILGGATGLVLNALGSKADEAYKKYQEDSIFAKKAIAEYQKRLRPENKA